MGLGGLVIGYSLIAEAPNPISRDQVLHLGRLHLKSNSTHTSSDRNSTVNSQLDCHTTASPSRCLTCLQSGTPADAGAAGRRASPPHRQHNTDRTRLEGAAWSSMRYGALSDTRRRRSRTPNGDPCRPRSLGPFPRCALTPGSIYLALGALCLIPNPSLLVGKTAHLQFVNVAARMPVVL